MDKNSYKILKFLNKHNSIKFSISEIHKHFPEISKDYLIEIIHNLKTNDYIKYIGDSSIRSTNKGRTYSSVMRSNWISEHIIETLALIIAFIALIVSIVALVRTF